MTAETTVKDENIVWHQHSVDKQFRAELKKQKPAVLWFTGLSGAGKSTVAGALENRLAALGYHTYLLDGDNVRHGLCSDLGFSEQDRRENIRRIGELAKLMADAGLIVLSAFISPHRAERQLVRDLLPEGEFIEVFVNARVYTVKPVRERFLISLVLIRNIKRQRTLKSICPREKRVSMSWWTCAWKRLSRVQ